MPVTISDVFFLHCRHFHRSSVDTHNNKALFYVYTIFRVTSDMSDADYAGDKEQVQNRF